MQDKKLHGWSPHLKPQIWHMPLPAGWGPKKRSFMLKKRYKVHKKVPKILRKDDNLQYDIDTVIKCAKSLGLDHFFRLEVYLFAEMLE